MPLITLTPKDIPTEDLVANNWSEIEGEIIETVNKLRKEAGMDPTDVLPRLAKCPWRRTTEKMAAIELRAETVPDLNFEAISSHIVRDLAAILQKYGLTVAAGEGWMTFLDGSWVGIKGAPDEEPEIETAGNY